MEQTRILTSADVATWQTRLEAQAEQRMLIAEDRAELAIICSMAQQQLGQPYRLLVINDLADIDLSRRVWRSEHGQPIELDGKRYKSIMQHYDIVTDQTVYVLKEVQPTA